jgi:hypothetical protein
VHFVVLLEKGFVSLKKELCLKASLCYASVAMSALSGSCIRPANVDEKTLEVVQSERKNRNKLSRK